MKSAGVLELVETGSSTEDFVISFISLATKFIAGSVIQSVLLTGLEWYKSAAFDMADS